MAAAQDASAAIGAAAPMPDLRAPPRGVKYGQLLPLGVKGRQTTRKFFPNNGTSFSASSNNVARIPLNVRMIKRQNCYILKRTVY